MSYNDIIASIKTGAYTIGGQAKELTQQGIELVSSYATYVHNQVQNNQTVMSYNQFANDHIKKLKLAGIVVADDLAKTGQDFMTNTITGQTITSWANQAQKKIVDTANDIDNQSGGFFSKNKTGLITAGVVFAAASYFLGPLMGLLIGLGSGAALGFAQDKDSSLKTLWAQNTPDANHTPKGEQVASAAGHTESKETSAPNHVPTGTNVSPTVISPPKPTQAPSQTLPQ